MWIKPIRRATFLLACSFALACHTASGVHHANDLRTMLREHLKNPEFSLDRKPEYVVTDPAFIEPILDQALKYIDTSPPLSAETLGKAKASAVTYYRLGLAKPEGLKALQVRIAERFARPIVTRRASPENPEKHAIDLDFGWMKGPLTANTRYGIEIDATRTEYAQDFEGRAPSTALLAGLLSEAVRAYPDADRVSVNMTFPRSRMGTQFRATYIRAGFPQSRNGWVLLQSISSPTTLPMFQVRINNEDFSPYRDGRYSFYVDCAPMAGAARIPQTSVALTESQRKQCLSF